MPSFSRRGLFGLTAACVPAALVTAGGLGRAMAAPAAQNLPFMLHAVFFSNEMHIARPLDPHAFVQDEAAPAAVGPQNIHHAAGFRPALVAGPLDVATFNANGQSLGFTLADWFGAKGDVRLTRSGAGARVACRFTGLRPNGVYSLFENHFDKTPIGFTPLDGTGRGNDFTADANGSAAISLRSPGKLTHDNAVLLVYHSDHKAHGDQRGEIGVTAHHQLIARIPG